MKITITDGNQVTNFDVETDQPIEDIKALIEAEVTQIIFRWEFPSKDHNCTSMENYCLITPSLTNLEYSKMHYYFSVFQM